MPEKDNSNLLKPGSAVEDFLDTLLQESTEQPRIKKIERLKTKSNLVLLPDLLVEPAIADALIDPEVKKTAQEVTHSEQLLPAEKKESDLQISSYDYRFPLQCLMFTVGENQLSIPLVNMGSVLHWGNRLTMLPGSPDWFLGILKHRQVNVKVADTAKVIKINNIKTDHSNVRHILVIGDNEWAITCDKLGDVVKLREEDVKWTKKGGNTLLLGTIKQSLAILLDPYKLLNQLNKHESSRIKLKT